MSRTFDTYDILLTNQEGSTGVIQFRGEVIPSLQANGDLKRIARLNIKTLQTVIDTIKKGGYEYIDIAGFSVNVKEQQQLLMCLLRPAGNDDIKPEIGHSESDWYTIISLDQEKPENHNLGEYSAPEEATPEEGADSDSEGAEDPEPMDNQINMPVHVDGKPSSGKCMAAKCPYCRIDPIDNDYDYCSYDCALLSDLPRCPAPKPEEEDA